MSQRRRDKNVTTKKDKNVTKTKIQLCHNEIGTNFKKKEKRKKRDKNVPTEK